METLYNGILLPDRWPPAPVYAQQNDDPMPVPYLDHPPEPVPIDVGRQLFVDDFLIEESTLRRRFHNAEKDPGNPVMAPATDFEQGDGMPAAVPKSGGVWWDSSAKIYRMWYDAGWSHKYAYATSKDGLNWDRQGLLRKRTGNAPLDLVTNSSAAFIDFDESDPARRFKLFIRQPDAAESKGGDGFGNGRHRAYILYSDDGRHWSNPLITSPVGDRSTLFYNPFRKKWIYSIRSYAFKPTVRTRHYRECADLIGERVWEEEEEVFWTRADRFDPANPAFNESPQLYNLDAIGYESLLLGLFEIHLGPRNNTCAQGGFPKITDLKLGFSRDGFHWHRPHRDAFIASTRRAGDWDRGYVQSVGGCCLVYQDELRFYYTGFKGDETKKSEKEAWNCGMYANASTGMARLRRDGFASLDADSSSGRLTTRPLTFNGHHLFVNARTPRGELRVEVIGADGRTMKGYTAAECIPLQMDSCKAAVTWKSKSVLPTSGFPLRFQFHLTRGSLYSFWVSRSARGESDGFLGAGGPDYRGYRDSA